jgi:CheY-like chemotaxis protein
MVVGPRIQQAIEMRKGHLTIERLAIQGGMRLMRDVALEWVTLGKTTLSEVERVLGQPIEEENKQSKGPTRILLADDDEEECLRLTIHLEREGYELVAVKDGREAVELLKTDPNFSLVLLDLFMPRLDGRQVLNWIRDSTETAAIPVMIRTGAEGVESEAELLEAGADDYVTKSLPPNRFLARVRAMLRRAAL